MRTTLSLLALTATLAGCSDYAMSEGDMGDWASEPPMDESMGDLDVSTGGAQDFDQVRQLIEEGQVPWPDEISTTGLLNEHDLPLQGNEECVDPLCITAAAGIAPLVPADQDLAWVQFGYDTGLTSFERSAQDLSVVVDVSCSMTDLWPDVRASLHELADQLDERDRVSIVTFGTHASIHMNPMNGAAQDAIHDAIDAIQIDGSTNLEGGMSLGYGLLRDGMDEAHQSRMILLTDAMPNTGSTDATSFMSQIGDHADMGIGLTMLGIGSDFQASFGLQLTEFRGANFFYLADSEDIEQTFDDFDLMVTPVAYDLHVRVEADSELVGSWNVQKAEDGEYIEATVATLFFSRSGSEGGGGGSYFALDAAGLDGDSTLGRASIKYTDALNDREVDHSFDILPSVDMDSSSAPRAGWENMGLRKGVALINQAEAMTALCDAFHNDGDIQSTLQDVYNPTLDLLINEADRLESKALEAEVKWMIALRSNVLSGS